MSFLLEHIDKQSRLISAAFNNDTRFTSAQDLAFVALLNDPSIFEKEGKCPEILANHIDALFRKKALSKKFTREQIEKRLIGLLTILKYINAKDIFMRHYKLHLTRRLVLNMSSDEVKRTTCINFNYLFLIRLKSSVISRGYETLECQQTVSTS